MIFSRFGVDFRPPNPPKNALKTCWNRSRTAKPEGQKNDTPLMVFASFSRSKRCRKAWKIKKKRFQDVYKNLSIFSTDFEAIFAGFSSHLGPKNLKIATEISCKIQAKKSLKNDTKNFDFGLQNGPGFCRFWLLKSTLGGTLGPSRRPNRKSRPKFAKSHQIYEKMIQKWSKKITRVMKKCFKNDFKSIPKCWKNIEQQAIESLEI